MEVTTTWYLVLGAMLFSIGGTGLLIRRNPLVMFMCDELMLNAVTLTLITFSRFSTSDRPITGQTFVVFIITVAAAEAAAQGASLTPDEDVRKAKPKPDLFDMVPESEGGAAPEGSAPHADTPAIGGPAGPQPGGMPGMPPIGYPVEGGQHRSQP